MVSLIASIDCEEAYRWLKQAKHTFEAIRSDLDGGFFDWACFKAQQAGECALKAILRGAGIESFGHNLVELWRKAVRICETLNDLFECIALLNKLYVLSRYPNAWPTGAVPYESFTKRDALEALKCAEKVLRAVEECIHVLCKSSEEKG